MNLGNQKSKLKGKHKNRRKENSLRAGCHNICAGVKKKVMILGTEETEGLRWKLEKGIRKVEMEKCTHVFCHNTCLWTARGKKYDRVMILKTKETEDCSWRRNIQKTNSRKRK